MMKPHLTYDDEVDVLGIWLSDAKRARTVDFAPGITAELAADGNLIYLENMNARERIDNSVLLEELPVAVEG
jgi:hypothetical protein